MTNPFVEALERAEALLAQTVREREDYNGAHQRACLRIAKARSALFPDPVPDPERANHFVSIDVIDNLTGVLYDLRRCKADEICCRTIDGVIDQLTEARKALVDDL